MPSEHNDEWPGGQAKEALDEFRKNFVLRQVLEAVDGIDADYMTSEDHHPGYVLIPTAKFEEIRIASDNYNQRAAQSDKINFGRECSYDHPVGTRCPICSDWPYAKGGAAAFNERTAAMDALIADSADLYDAPASADALGEVAEDLAREIADLFEDASNNPCTCNIDENSCRHCSAWVRAAHTTKERLTAAMSAMSPAGEVERIVAWLRRRGGQLLRTESSADQIAGAELLMKAGEIERGDYRHD